MQPLDVAQPFQAVRSLVKTKNANVEMGTYWGIWFAPFAYVIT